MPFLAVGRLNNDRTIMSEAFAHIKLTLMIRALSVSSALSFIVLITCGSMTYDIVYHDLRYRISTYDIVYQPTISYIDDRSYQPCDCRQPCSSKKKQSVSPNMPPNPLKRGRFLGQQEGLEALDMWCPSARGCLWQR